MSWLTVAALSTTLVAAPKRTPHNTEASSEEPFHSFRMLDAKLTLLTNQQDALSAAFNPAQMGSRSEAANSGRHKNDCEQAVTCPLKVAVGNEPDGSSGHSQWTLMKENPRHAAIDAHGEKLISGGITWAGDAPDGTNLVFRYSDGGEDDEFVMDCAYTADNQ